MSDATNGLLLRDGNWTAVQPATAGWTYVSFGVERLSPGALLSSTSGGEEVALVPLAGRLTVQAEGELWELGRRRSVFDGRGEFLYLPRETDYTVTSESGAEFARCGAWCEQRLSPVHVRAEELAVETRGGGNATRQIRTLIPPEFPADRLLVVEVWTPGGNWSSYPPHKHDESRDGEAVLEETYYFRTGDRRGFAFQRLYSPSRAVDFSWTVGDGDLLLVPWGYHTTCAAHGHDLYYLNVLAGPGRSRTLQAHVDPDLLDTRDDWDRLGADPRVPIVAGIGTLS